MSSEVFGYVRVIYESLSKSKIKISCLYLGKVDAYQFLLSLSKNEVPNFWKFWTKLSIFESINAIGLVTGIEHNTGVCFIRELERLAWSEDTPGCGINIFSKKLLNWVRIFSECFSMVAFSIII